MEKRPKFDNNQAKTNFPAYVQAMETEVFRPHHTEEQKIECLRQLVSGDYAAKVTELSRAMPFDGARNIFAMVVPKGLRSDPR